VVLHAFGMGQGSGGMPCGFSQLSTSLTLAAVPVGKVLSARLSSERSSHWFLCVRTMYRRYTHRQAHRLEV
jgi:hypothetical protein